jgi:hypothetical protein
VSAKALNAQLADNYRMISPVDECRERLGGGRPQDANPGGFKRRLRGGLPIGFNRAIGKIGNGKYPDRAPDTLGTGRTQPVPGSVFGTLVIATTTRLPPESTFHP